MDSPGQPSIAIAQQPVGVAAGPRAGTRTGGAGLPRRIGRIVLLFIAGFLGVWLARSPVLHWLTAPLVDALRWTGPERPALLLQRSYELFSAYVSLASAGGFLAAAPWLMLELCTLILRSLGRAAPNAAWFVLGSYVALAAGVALGRYVVLPIAIGRLLEEQSDLASHVEVANYVSFATTPLLGLAFFAQLLVVLFFVVRAPKQASS